MARIAPVESAAGRGVKIPESRRLRLGTLARFASGLRWAEIHTITSGRRRTWWRHAIVDAELRGLLEWDRPTKTWRLTDRGRELVKDVS